MTDLVTASVLSVFLSVSYVGENKGFPNTEDGAYVCGFDKTRYQISDAGDINVYFVPSTDRRFIMQGVRIDNDAAGDYSQRAAQVQGRKLSFYAANTTKQRIYFTVDVLDTETGNVIACDPDIDNEEPK